MPESKQKNGSHSFKVKLLSSFTFMNYSNAQIVKQLVVPVYNLGVHPMR